VLFRLIVSILRGVGTSAGGLGPITCRLPLLFRAPGGGDGGRFFAAGAEASGQAEAAGHP
jgi:hypothetical protein